MPQQGEIRHGSTESVQWDGSRWNPITTQKGSVDNPVSFGWLDAVPGLRDALNIPVNAVKGAQALPDVVRGLVHEPAATLKGFAGGVSEAATPGRLGLLALLTGGATLPAALAAGGGEALAQGTRVATDAPNAPQSFPEAAGNVAEAAAVPAIAGAAKAVPGVVQRLGGTRKLGSRILGAGYGGYEGYQHGGLGGMLGGAVAGGIAGDVLGGGSPTMRALRMVMGGGAADEAAADVSPAGVDRYLPNRSGVPISREVPGFSMPANGTPAVEPPLPRSVLSDVDRYMPNSGGIAPVENPVQTQRVGLTGDAARPAAYSGDVGRISGKAPTLNQSLQDAVESLREPVDPRDPLREDSQSMRGLKDAMAAEGVNPTHDAMASSADPRDEIVRRYLNASPDSALSRFSSLSR